MKLFAGAKIGDLQDRRGPDRGTRRRVLAAGTLTGLVLASLLAVVRPPAAPADGVGETAPSPAGPLRRAEEPPPATGTLEGVVTLGGDTLPSSTIVENSTDPEICGTEHSLRNLVVSEENRGVRHVVVSLTDVPEEVIPDRTPGRLVIDNRDCQFVPHVAVATVGDTVVALNSDSTLHNTHYYGPMRSNISLAVEGMTAFRVARRTGLVTVLCDVHGWMTAYIHIDPHPFHAVTDARGRFRIEGVPAGSYTLKLWHEELGSREVEVEVAAGEVATVDVEYPEPGE